MSKRERWPFISQWTTYDSTTFLLYTFGLFIAGMKVASCSACAQ